MFQCTKYIFQWFIWNLYYNEWNLWYDLKCNKNQVILYLNYFYAYRTMCGKFTKIWFTVENVIKFHFQQTHLIQRFDFCIFKLIFSESTTSSDRMILVFSTEYNIPIIWIWNFIDSCKTIQQYMLQINFNNAIKSITFDSLCTFSIRVN